MGAAQVLCRANKDVEYRNTWIGDSLEPLWAGLFDIHVEFALICHSQTLMTAKLSEELEQAPFRCHERKKILKYFYCTLEIMLAD